jgi:hypothetical protein
MDLLNTMAEWYTQQVAKKPRVTGPVHAHRRVSVIPNQMGRARMQGGIG